ncbi:MAG: hypothetical protein ACU837_05550 [Gammaproteobacteria bacterium]
MPKQQTMIPLRGINDVNRGYWFRATALMLLCTLLSGCVYWRLYQTKLQLEEFDRNFAIEVNDHFIWHFKDPLLYSDDFVALSKLYPTSSEPKGTGKLQHYRFYKADSRGRAAIPGVEFMFDLSFNGDDLLTAWSFSPVFLQIAPPEFLEVSLRSLGGAEINEDKRQLKADTRSMGKISAHFPKKAEVLKRLGTPLTIEQKKAEAEEIYIYHFLLDTPNIEKGYEDRALSEVRLTFDTATQEMVKMSGRFAGLKISIDYRKFVAKDRQTARDFKSG